MPWFRAASCNSSAEMASPGSAIRAAALTWSSVVTTPPPATAYGSRLRHRSDRAVYPCRMSDVTRYKGSAAARRAGVLGAVVGIAAAGVAAGVAVERLLTRRGARRTVVDPFAEERFGPQPYDECRMVTTDEGIDLY